MAGVHLASGVYILANIKKVPDNFREIQTYLSKVVIGDGANEYGYGFKEFAKANLPVMIAIFFIITAVFHLIYAYGRKTFYREYIENGVNPLRWLEYSITATIMTVIMALAATIQEVQQLMLIVVATVCIMLLGWVIEKSIADKQRQVAWGATGIAWFLQFAVFGVIAYAFISTIQEVNKKLAEEQREERIPGFVYAILISQLFFFSLFGFVSLRMLVQSGKGPIDFYRYEVGYHSLSIISKLTLGWLFYAGALMERGDENTQAPQTPETQAPASARGQACNSDSDCVGEFNTCCEATDQSPGCQDLCISA